MTNECVCGDERKASSCDGREKIHKGSKTSLLKCDKSDLRTGTASRKNQHKQRHDNRLYMPYAGNECTALTGARERQK